jgi:hypothetical protein
MSRKITKEAAQKLSELGASKGGKARDNVLSSEQKSLIARNAAAARWGKKEPAESAKVPAVEVAPKEAMPYSMFRGELSIGTLKMECHVLSDGRRTFTQREILKALVPGTEAGHLARYLENNPLIDKDLVLEQVLQFRVPGTQFVANGYEATQLIDICDKYLEADEQGLLKSNQKRLAKQAGIILRLSMRRLDTSNSEKSASCS